MSAPTRILGQDVTLRITQDGVALSQITAVESATFHPKVRTLSEQFLGETAMRQDEIFDEVDVSVVIQPEGIQLFQMQLDVVNRAIVRQQAGRPTFNFSFKISFPAGGSARILVPDLSFDLGPLNVPERDQYANLNLAGKSDRYKLLT